MLPVGLANIRISTGYATNLPDSWLLLYISKNITIQYQLGCLDIIEHAYLYLIWSETT